MQMKFYVTITAPEIADAILTLANAISQIQIASETQKNGEKMEDTNKAETAPIDKVQIQPQDQPIQSLPTPLETLRAKLINISRDGKQPQIKSLISSFVVNKLTDIPESKYEEILAEVEKW